MFKWLKKPPVEPDLGNLSALAPSRCDEELSIINDHISNVAVYGLNESVAASKYPMAVDTTACTCEITTGVVGRGTAPSGSAHDCFLKGIVVEFDLRCSKQMLAELERYHHLDIISSQSTMHRITKMDPTKQCNEYVDERVLAVLRELICTYEQEPTPENYLKVLYNAPSGYELTMRIVTNYLQLKTIYHQRRNHRLPEWRAFCEWVRKLPYFNQLVLKEAE